MASPHPEADMRTTDTANDMAPREVMRSCDVMVIGGGPGGAATAAFLAMAGIDTVLVEKDRHPRFHIGESLLPHTLPILEELGVLDRVDKIGVFKGGAEFVNHDGTQDAVFSFDRALLKGPSHAYQVRRSEFDHLLFQRAGECGAVTLEETEASILSFEDDAALVRTVSAEGETTDWQTRFLVDASGRSTITSKLLEQKRPDPHNTSAAIFGHFRGVPRHDGVRGGNIRIHLTNPGWMWQIPLRDDITSIGFVAPGAYLKDRTGTIEQVFNQHCARHAHLSDLIAGAIRDEPLRATGNFSYRSTDATGPRHIKVGDAYGFIDPVFSTGVHLALNSAREAAQTIRTCLKDRGKRKALLAAYDRRIRRRLAYVSWFIYKINDPSFRDMMLHPQNILGVEQAVISLLAGDFRWDPRLRARIALFKMFRYVTELGGPRPKMVETPG